MKFQLLNLAVLPNSSLVHTDNSSFKMHSQILPLSFSLALLTLTSAVPIHNAPGGVPAGLNGAYNGARLDTILKRDEQSGAPFGSKFHEPILPRDRSSHNTETSDVPIGVSKGSLPSPGDHLVGRERIEPIFPRDHLVRRERIEPILPRDKSGYSMEMPDVSIEVPKSSPPSPGDHLVGRERIEPIFPRDKSSKNIIMPAVPIEAPNSSPPNPGNHVLPREHGMDTDGKPEVWEEAKFDPRAEVADGRGAKKGSWRNAANQFLPS